MRGELIWVVFCAAARRMIYSSINPRVHLLRTAEHEHEHTMLDFSENRARGYYSREFGVGHPSVERLCFGSPRADAVVTLRPDRSGVSVSRPIKRRLWRGLDRVRL